METGRNNNKRTIKPLNVQIPAWIGSIESISAKAKLKPDRVRVILHQFFLAWLKDKAIKKSRKVNRLPEYFAVSSEILKEVGTKDYSRFVQMLIAEGIIERKSNDTGGKCYLVGGHAQLYRWILPSEYVGKPKFRIEKVNDYLTVKSILRTRDNHQKIDDRIGVGGKYLPVFETLRNFVLDTTVVNAGEDDFDCLDELDWFVVDEFGGRLHHRISNMPKELRKNLRFKGYEDIPLTTIDFRNSQPYFSAMVSNRTLIETLLPEFKPVISLTEQLSKKPDFQLYRQLCVEGSLYEFFLHGRGVDPTNQLERLKIKTDLFRAVLYCKKRVYGDDKRLQDMFKSAFPSVFSFFSGIKRLNEFDLPELKSIIKPSGKVFKYSQSNNSYKLLPCMMQRAESRMMYQIIAPKLIEAGVKFITVHDSFMILPEYTELTLRVIKEQFQTQGLNTPTLHVHLK